MTLSVVIVTRNNERQIGQCLTSVMHDIDLSFRDRGNVSTEVFVVDNASSDRTRRVVQGDFPQTKTMWNEENRGFASAVNQAMRVATNEVVLLLNPDTIVLPGALASMLAFLDTHPGVGVAGGKILNMDGTVQPSVRRFPDALSQMIILTKLHRAFPRLTAQYLCQGFAYDTKQEVDQVRGAYFFVTRRAIERVGLLDDRNFFMWFEEVDYCRRVREAGLTVNYVPGSTVMHEGGSSFAQVHSAIKQRWFNRSMRNYFWKYRQYGAAVMVVALSPLSIFLAYLSALTVRKPAPYV